jgi:hypothetical protein
MKPGDLAQVVSLPGFVKDIVWCCSDATGKVDARIPVGSLAVVLDIEVNERSDWNFETSATVLIEGQKYTIRLANLQLITENQADTGL